MSLDNVATIKVPFESIKSIFAYYGPNRQDRAYINFLIGYQKAENNSTSVFLPSTIAELGESCHIIIIPKDDQPYVLATLHSKDLTNQKKWSRVEDEWPDELKRLKLWNF